MTKLIKHKTLRECFLAYIQEPNLTDEEAKKHYWVGNNGRRGFRIRVDKWLASDVKCWGWASYKEKEVHVWASPEVTALDLIPLLCHELGHLQRPRYPFGFDEEKKASIYGKVAATAVEMAKELTTNKEV